MDANIIVLLILTHLVAGLLGVCVGIQICNMIIDAKFKE